MKVLAFLTLFMSIAIFAKPRINYKLLPKDANVFGYISTNSFMKNKHFKKFMKTKDAKASIRKMKKMGIDIKKLGSISFHSNFESLMKNKKDAKNADFSIILHGINLEKVAKLQLKKLKGAKTQKYNGATIYQDFKVKGNEKGEFEALTFLNDNTIMGSIKGVKKVIDTSKGKSFSNKKMVNKLLSTLKSPEFFVLNIVQASQKTLIQQAITKNAANPAVAMLGLNSLANNIKLFAFAGNLTSKKLKLTFLLKADKAGVSSFTQTLNMQFKNFKPMLEQQINNYSRLIGKDAAKELKSIMNSLKIVKKGDLALISIVINIDNTVRILKKLQKKQGKTPNMMKMKR